jgi:hypothetical protein
MQAENTTRHKRTQVPVTQPHVVVDHENDEYLQVRPDIPVLDAIERSSCRIAEILLFLREHYDDETGLKVSGVYMVQEHLISAKALIDASVNGLIAAQREGGAV